MGTEKLRAPDLSGNVGHDGGEVRWIGSGNLPGVEDKKTRGGFVRGLVFVLYGKILPFKIPHSSS
jgi:hypothetical protein